LPVPPTVILPTTITGTDSEQDFSSPLRYKNLRNFTSQVNNILSGINKWLTKESLYQVAIAQRASVLFII
jgi:hypothetical protein